MFISLVANPCVTHCPLHSCLCTASLFSLNFAFSRWYALTSIPPTLVLLALKPKKGTRYSDYSKVPVPFDLDYNLYNCNRAPTPWRPPTIPYSIRMLQCTRQDQGLVNYFHDLMLIVVHSAASRSGPTSSVFRIVFGRVSHCNSRSSQRYGPQALPSPLASPAH